MGCTGSRPVPAESPPLPPSLPREGETETTLPAGTASAVAPVAQHDVATAPDDVVLRPGAENGIEMATTSASAAPSAAADAMRAAPAGASGIRAAAPPPKASPAATSPPPQGSTNIESSSTTSDAGPLDFLATWLGRRGPRPGLGADDVASTNFARSLLDHLLSASERPALPIQAHAARLASGHRGLSRAALRAIGALPASCKRGDHVGCRR